MKLETETETETEMEGSFSLRESEREIDEERSLERPLVSAASIYIYALAVHNDKVAQIRQQQNASPSVYPRSLAASEA